MTRLTRLGGWIATVFLAVVGLGVLAAPSAAMAEEKKYDTYEVHVNAKDAAYHYRLCLKSTTSIRETNGKHHDRTCTSEPCKNTGMGGEHTLSIPYEPGDQVWMDIEMFMNLHDCSSKTQDNNELTGSHECTLSGPVHAGKFKCENASNKIDYKMPSIAAYTPGDNIPNLLGLMAWCVSAAGVIGLLMIGARLASSLRYGAFNEQVEYLRQIGLVFGACLIATAAGPVIEFLDLVD